jgi:transglutaminase-like putative cysteine protease
MMTARRIRLGSSVILRLVPILGLLEAAPASGAEPGGNEGYALATAPVKQVRAELRFELQAPRLLAREWVVYGAQLPVLPCQTGVSSRLLPDGESGRELSPERRPILRSRIPASTAERKTSLDVRLEYQATLLSRRLVRRKPAADAAPVAAPDGEERRAALAAGKHFDFNSDGFRRWLDDGGLKRGPDEGEIDYARRVFLAIKKGFRYVSNDNLDRLASHVCRAGESDCVGLSILFVSTLRAAGIPARSLVGRWAKSGEEGGQGYNQWHAKAEFYAQGVGWIPADPACAVVHDRSPEGLVFFGNDPGDFLVMHLDTDLVCDTLAFGRQTVALLQRPAHWMTGSGSFEGATTREYWTVTSSPAPDLVEAALEKPSSPVEKPKRGRTKSRPRSPR